MKTILLTSAAALAMLCASGAALAGTVSISFDKLCDGMDITVNTVDRTALSLGNGCDVGANFGIGTMGRIKNRGRTVTLAVNLSGKGGSAYQYVYVVDYPFVTGGSWSNFYTTDGITMSRITYGTYTVGGTAARKANGLKSSTDPR
jgi:hypothetical protein